MKSLYHFYKPADPFNVMLYYAFCITVSLCFSTIEIAYCQNNVFLNSKIYHDDVATVLLNPLKNNIIEETQPPIIKLNGSDKLILRFDIINGDLRDYKLKLIHCTHDWRQSPINSIAFLKAYNEFRIDQKEESFNTRTPYIHYHFTLPKTTISGNYILQVYEEDDENDLLFTWRFVVFEQKVSITPRIEKGYANNNGQAFQRIPFTVNYKYTDIVDPNTTVNAYIRQNYSWKNMRYFKKPQYVKDFQKILEYTSYEQKYLFYGTNEYRIFDIRSTLAPGRFVNNIERSDNKIDAWLQPTFSKEGTAYSEEVDLDGAYIISSGNQLDTAVEGDYFNVHFQLKVTSDMNMPILIDGAFTEGFPDSKFEMYYDIEYKKFFTSIRLKQGYYNYRYVMPQSNTPFALEGSHFETNNSYEIFIYHRNRRNRYDQVLGYFRTQSRQL